MIDCYIDDQIIRSSFIHVSASMKFMPTIISHAIAAAAVGHAYPERRLPARFWVWTAVCSMLPDADVIGFAYGIRYADMLGHRGLSHSFFFAAVVGVVVAALYPGRRALAKVAGAGGCKSVGGPGLPRILPRSPRRMRCSTR